MSGGPMEPVRTLVAEDEPEARRGILELLSGDPEIDVVAAAGTGGEAVALLESARPELVLLDIQMPQLDGFEVLERAAGPESPVIVFVTAWDQYALRAFEAHAVDYLLKPFSDDRFAEAVAHAKAQVRQRRVGRIGRRLAAAVGGVEPATEDQAAPLYADRLLVPSGEGSLVIRTEEIDWIEARNYCAKLHLGAREYLIRQTLKGLEARLDPARFVRIHRSAIVNLDRIRTLEPYFHGSRVVILVSGTRLPLSRSRRQALERALGDRVG